MKFGMVSLGCHKNQVDAEVIVGQLKAAGHTLVSVGEDAEMVIVNTCGFIREAKEESIDAILEVASLRDSGSMKHLVVTGCLSQRYRPQLMREMPEVDAYLGVDEAADIAGIVESLVSGVLGEAQEAAPEPGWIYSHDTPRTRFTPPHRAFLKIADGCDNRCAYCAIPIIRGPKRSRSQKSILEEARAMAAEGVREITLIAQDTTAYGAGRDGVSKLPALLGKLEKVRGIDWIRLMYAHPAHLTDDVLDVMAAGGKTLPYIDLPVQHINADILKAMGRTPGPDRIRSLLERIKKKVPDAAIRTSFLVGFPGETKEKFRELLRFVKEGWFDHAGVFKYSDEEGTRAAGMPRWVSDELKEERRAALMKAQSAVSLKKNRARAGNVYRVLVEGPSDETEHLLTGRAYFQAPEVDGTVYINDGYADTGEIVDVEITEAHPYDLVGRVAG